MSVLRGSRRTLRPSLPPAKALVLRVAPFFFASAVGACGGSTGRDGAAAQDAGSSAAAARDAMTDAMVDVTASDGAATDATVSPIGDAVANGTTFDLDEGLFDVDIPHADRVLPDVQVVAAMDSGAGAQDSGGPDAPAEDGSACLPFNTFPVTMQLDGATVLPDAAAYPCTPTEQRFVDHSVDCYKCLVNGSCLDDAQFGDMGKECDDLPGNAKIGDKAGTPLRQLCLETIECIFMTKCSAPDDAGTADVARCYCGSLLGSECATSSAPGDGLCALQEANGSEHFVTDKASVVSPTLADVTLAAGKADAIFACAQLNGCTDVCLK